MNSGLARYEDPECWARFSVSNLNFSTCICVTDNVEYRREAVRVSDDRHPYVLVGDEEAPEKVEVYAGLLGEDEVHSLLVLTQQVLLPMVLEIQGDVHVDEQ